jgi:hypothetical protein
MARRRDFDDDGKRRPWSKREVVLAVVIGGCLIGWFFLHENNTDEFLSKTRQVEVGMSLQKAVAIIGKPTKRQETREDLLRHDERPRYAELGKDNPLTEITWDGPGYIFRAFVVKDEIIAIRNKRKGRM